MRLWIERRFWDAWTESEKAQFSSGQAIRAEGLLTYVLSEAVIDISDPVLTD
jgi:hypothetical protein